MNDLYRERQKTMLLCWQSNMADLSSDQQKSTTRQKSEVSTLMSLSGICRHACALQEDTQFLKRHYTGI